MNLKVRPFETNIRGVDADGTIEGNEYVVSFYGIPFRIPAIEQQRDEWGAYAIIQEAEIPLSDGFRLRVEMEPEPDMLHGCVISFERLEDEPLKAFAKPSGIDLNSVNLMIPPK
jgi:hypothetical protein